MPMEELMSLYRHTGDQLSDEHSQSPVDDDLSLDAPSISSELHDTRSSSEEEILSNQDLTLDKDEIARDLLKNVDNPEQETSVTDLLQSVHVPSQTARLLRCKCTGIFYLGSRCLPVSLKLAEDNNML